MEPESSFKRRLGRFPGRAASLTASLLTLALVFAPLSGRADDRVPTGTLRAVFLAQNPVQARTDAKTGEVSGPAADLTRKLAEALGVPFVIAGVAGTAAVMQQVSAGNADIGFLAYDETRAKEVDFSQTYALAQNTYLVLQSSPLRTTADIDQAGLKIGVGERDAADMFLDRTLKTAKLVRNPGGNLDTALSQLNTGQIDAYAANRQRLSRFAKEHDGVRLLPDNFYGVEQAIVVRKGNKELLDAVNATIADARQNGLISAAIARAGLTGVDVAPERKDR
ncbi:MAG: transporter substrate-binding domain-containing protein [Pseudolabrys sp.]